ncbi:MAG TPA: extracellular solute-binding protein [Clostridiales bacterium]|nr:extracellular solute-binding protein [Clostridiales bacterium]
MKRLSQLIALCLAMSMLFVSCAKGGGDTASDTTASQVTEAETTELEARQAIPDDLPSKDFGGREFRIYSSTGREDTFYTDEQNGEVINDAIFTAIAKTEERFNVDVVNIDSTGDDGGHNEKIRSIITAGEDAFEIAENHDSLSGGLAMQGLLMNLYDVPYLNFEKPWWPSNAVETLTFRNKMFLASSNFSYRGFHWTRVIFFNKDLLVDYNMEEPYKYVFDGTWTLDKLASLVKDTYSDLNGNSQRDKDDLYGYVAEGPVYCYLEQYDLSPLIKTPDGGLELGINNSRTLTLVEKMYSLLHESQGAIITDYGMSYDWFSTNRALFAFGEIYYAVDKYRYTDINYGIVMQPKLDDAQKDYRAEYTDRFILFPITLQDTEFAGIIFEAMSAEGYKLVFPAYYEIALKQKFTYDDESVQVLDIINDVRVLDFSYVYIPDIFGLLNTLLYNNPSKDFASLYAKSEKSLNAKIKQLIESYDKLEQMLG